MSTFWKIMVVKAEGAYTFVFAVGLLIVLLFFQTASADLMALYRFDDSTANDVPGGNKIGAHKGESFDGVNVTKLSFVSDTPNKSAAAASLNGRGYFDIIVKNPVNPFDSSKDFSITFWFKTTEPDGPKAAKRTGRGRVIISSADETYTNEHHYMHVFTENRGGMRLDYFNVESKQTKKVTLLDNTWHWIAITYTAADSMVRFYVDKAVEDASGRLKGNIPNIAEQTVRVGDSVSYEAMYEIGDDFPDGLLPWKGLLDDIAIFDHTLETEELARVLAGNFSAYVTGHAGGTQGPGEKEDSRPEPAEFDFSSLKTIPVKNYYAYSEPGRFGGWPANNGVWIWGNEILVGFEQGYHKAQSGGGHAIRRDMPQLNVLSRSLDGGKTWKVEDPDNFVDDGDEVKHCTGNINFAHPDFAMRVAGNKFFISYDRGRKWEGPFKIKGTKFDDMTSRTDYIVNGPKDCLVFLSAETGLVESNYQDRSFCARTTDGGKSFQFQGWMTHNIKVRSVMPSTVYVGEGHLVSAMRRKHKKKFENRPSITKNWIDVYESKDDGRTWKFLSKVAKTDAGDRNGNPPAMIRLTDGRLCVAYGYRAYPYGIRIKLSSDNGKTWGEEIYFRHDGGTWDLGYPRMVQRPDGKVVTIYYFNTKEVPAQHIAATIWDPNKVR